MYFALTMFLNLDYLYFKCFNSHMWSGATIQDLDHADQSISRGQPNPEIPSVYLIHSLPKSLLLTIQSPTYNHPQGQRPVFRIGLCRWDSLNVYAFRKVSIVGTHNQRGKDANSEHAPLFSTSTDKPIIH